MRAADPDRGDRSAVAAWVAPALAVPPLLLGMTVLAGWAVGSRALETMHPDDVAMKANAAIGVIAASLALATLARRARGGLRRAAQAAAALAALLGAVTLLEYALDRSLRIDELLFHESAGAVGTSAAGRMSGNVALSLLLLGAALVLLDRGSGRVWPGRVLAAVAGAIGTLALIGHASSVSSLSGFAGETRTALPAAVAIVFLALGVLAYEPPDEPLPRLLSPGVGGHLLRRLLPVSIGLPIVLGGLRLAGQETNLYGTRLGTWLFASAVVACISAGVWLVAVRFEAADAARSAAEAELASSERRQRLLLDHLPGTAVLAVDAGLRVTYACGSEPSRSLLFRRTAVGSHLEEMLDESEIRLVRPRVQAALDGEPQSFDLLTGRTARDYAVQVVPLEGGAMLVARDVTERRRLEEHAREAQRQEGITLLAGGIAHDFNNLLMVVLGNAETISTELPGPPELRGHADAIALAAEQASELTRSLLAYAGRGSRVEGDVALTPLVRDVVGLVRAIVPPETELDLDLDDSLPPVRGDTSQLQQVVLNLIVNASEAIGGRPGRIGVRTSLVEADDALLDSLAMADVPAPGTYVCLEVDDTGPGIEPDHRGRIFDPFFTTKYTGHGLGLAAVLGIVRSHRGGIRVASEPGRGSTFLVALPAGVRERPSADTEAEPWSESGLVLLVDDDDAVRDVAAHALARLGLTVVTAAGGREAIARLAAAPKDVRAAIVDLRMRGMPGGEVVAALRAIRPDMPILITSGSPEDTIPDRLGTDPGIDFLQKPYRDETLAARLKRLLAWAASGVL